MQAVILAGGKSSRFGAPKALAQVGGKAMIERVIETLPFSLTQVTVVASPAAHRQIKFVLSRPGVQIVEQPQPLGTANALSYAASHIKDDFILMACDTLFAPSDVEWLTTKRPPALAVRSVGFRRQPGAIIRDDRIVEKPGEWANYDLESLMLYVLGTEVFRYLPQISLSERGEYEIQDAINMYLANSDSLTLYHVGEYHHLTTMEDYENIRALFHVAN